MPHPLFDLLKTRNEPTKSDRPDVPKDPVVDASAVAAKVGGDDVGGTPRHPAVPVGVQIGLTGPHVPHVAILAVQAPPSSSGSPGVTTFAPGLPRSIRREILFDIEWFDVRIRRRANHETQGEK